jgi:hypothetical protein
MTMKTIGLRTAMMSAMMITDARSAVTVTEQDRVSAVSAMWLAELARRNRKNMRKKDGVCVFTERGLIVFAGHVNG